MTEHENPQTSAPAGPSLFAAFKSDDADRLIGYLTEVFGFVLTARYEDDGKVAHAELRWPEGSGGVMLGDRRRDGETWTPQPGAQGCYVVTADPDALCERITGHGAEIIAPIADTPYGSREFAVKDPEGNLWSFGSYPGAPLPAAK
ncbi:VOC family protein [Gordonia sp. VNK21]|uniref:VOC family protein n=1 Tax=Gordonia sp. VNK21 TaxID=3382483 RepID=UPI0038D42807